MPHDQFSASDLLGSIVDDRFEVIEKLGEGGMGAVYKARQISMDRQVALKILLHDQRGDPISVERFRHEAYLASRLRHPNAIIIHDFGQSPDGLLYIAMEYLSGETLKDRLTRVGPLPVRSAVKIIGQTLRTIAEAHRMGLIHRDLKPDNIFLTTVEGDTDYVKVLDFGIAKLTAVNDSIGGYQGGLTVAGKIYGTPNYMSPEQIRGKPVDHQSDIYQLGVIFYEMLCGRRPFEAQTPVDVMMMHLRDAPPPLTSHRPDVPPELARTVMRALEKDRRLRFQSGDEFLENIENFKFNSGFYAVPVRMAAAMTAQTPLADDATIAQADAGELEELGQSALIDAIDFAEEKTVLEFDEGFNDPEEKTFFETDDEEDMVTSADAPPMPPAAPAAPPPGIHSMASFSAEIGQGAPRRPEDDSEIVELGEDEFERADPSLLVPIPDLEAQRAAAGQGRGTIAGMPGHNAPRYVTPAPPPASGPGAVPNKPTLAGHPGAVGYGPPPPRPVGAVPAPGATLQQGSPAAIARAAERAPPAPWPPRRCREPPDPARAGHAPARHAPARRRALGRRRAPPRAQLRERRARLRLQRRLPRPALRQGRPRPQDPARPPPRRRHGRRGRLPLPAHRGPRPRRPPRGHLARRARRPQRARRHRALRRAALRQRHPDRDRAHRADRRPPVPLRPRQRDLHRQDRRPRRPDLDVRAHPRRPGRRRPRDRRDHQRAARRPGPPRRHRARPHPAALRRQARRGRAPRRHPRRRHPDRRGAAHRSRDARRGQAPVSRPRPLAVAPARSIPRPTAAGASH
ncbi:MAG: serine/threonine protein kinase [Myxococcales bacterium]|nr:serine/threonine protein kinase [Myxococcales bacterium]